MKKIMINFGLGFFLATIMLTSCKNDDPIITDRNLQGTETYFPSSDASKQDLFYKPYVGYVGDPMPFYDPVDKDFKILYLQDYRPNQAFTYHPIWCVSTKDAASYTSLGEIISCGTANELDAAIGTGSTIYDNGVYYTFYTAHSPGMEITGGIGEAIMLATSTDFKTWTKDRQLLIWGEEEYSAKDFRDPLVFKGDDGIFHMLISTKKEGKGVLAEYTSKDLHNWTSAGVFMTMMWDRFYECPDLFKMGEWWYLIYSEQADFMRKVQYFKGRSLEELKACTANDAGIWPDNHEGIMDARGLYAGKTASDGENRYIWGWCPTRAGSNNINNNDWAGNLIAHKLVQNNDGTLSLCEVPAIKSLFPEGKSFENLTLQGETYKLLPRLGTLNRISLTVKTSNQWDKFGFSFARGSDSEVYYSVVVNPEGENRRKINFEEEGGIGFIGGADGYVFDTPSDGVYNITIINDNSVMTLYINGNVTYSNRIYGMPKNCWSINSYGGNISITDLKVSSIAY